MAENMLQPSGAETWLCVRDSLFLLAHDEERGFRRRLHPVSLNFALSAAVLCDLVLYDSLVVSAAGVVPMRPPADADPVASGYYERLVDAVRSAPGAPPDSLVTPKPLREALCLIAPDVTARTQALLTASNVLSVHNDWLGRHRYALTRPDLALSARLPARDAVIGEYSAIGVTLCVLVRVLGLHDALLLLDRSQLDPVLTRVEQLLREEATEPLNMIPFVTDALRAVIESRVVGVFG